MAKFVDIGRESYVGQRVFPRLALLYASSMVYREQAHYEFVRDYIQEYVEDVYFDLYATRGDYSMSLQVPADVTRRAFLEILRGRDVNRHRRRPQKISLSIHVYKVALNPFENTGGGEV
jgi:hypothetical protein